MCAMEKFVKNAAFESAKRFCEIHDKAIVTKFAYYSQLTMIYKNIGGKLEPINYPFDMQYKTKNIMYRNDLNELIMSVNVPMC